MGRRPHAIVSEHFERGEKLGDSSNRYSYTCRNCRQAFPKGRTEGLITHVIHRCPNIDAHVRQRAVREVQQHAPHGPEAHSQSGRSRGASIDTDCRSQSPTAIQISGLSREPSALETLAEVSRRHFDFSAPRRTDTSQNSDGVHTRNEETANGGLIRELRKTADMPESQRPTASVVVSSAGNDVVACIAPLMHTASQANERLERGAMAELQTSTLDPRLEARELKSASPAHLSTPPTDGPAFVRRNEGFAADMPRTTHQGMPLEHTTSGFGAAPRARGRFSDTRRKEVSETRKRGACIRCRMLKKPCSEGTPCLTCKSVESARLWKTSCLRTRLADEFALWSAGLFYGKARMSVPTAIHGLRQCQMSGSIEIRLRDSSTTRMTCCATAYTAGLVSRSSTLMEELQKDDPGLCTELPQPPPGTPYHITLLDESEGMSTKIDECIRKETIHCIGREPSAFIKSTLQHAQALVELEKTSAVLHTSGQNPRSSYSLHDQLLENVIMLWTGTNVLVSHKDIDVKIQYQPSNYRPGRMNGPEAVIMNDANGGSIDDITVQSKELITAQLLAAIESWCTALAKTVMNEIERRLLQRQQVSRISTFMSAVILLNCVERMTGLYWTHDPDLSSTTQDGTSPLAWPLNTTPHKFWLQGEHFADVLIMLLRMRGLPPKTTTMQNGCLVAVPDQPSRSRYSDTGRDSAQSEGQASLPAEWLDSLELKTVDLLRVRDDGVRDSSAGARAFDLAFISKVLLPPSK